MLRVLTLSTLFPNAAQATLGVFVERQTLGLAALDDVQVEVVSPIGLPPWPLTRHPHYRPRARLALRENWRGVIVHRPRFTVIPKIGERLTARAMAKALLPQLRKIRERFPFDVIDAEFFWPDGPAAMHLSRALGVPFSIKARGGDIQYWAHRPGVGGQLVGAARAADGMLSVSAALRGVMGSLGMPEDKIKVHYTGVDLDHFKPLDRAAAKARLGVHGPLIVTAGALIERKGQAIVLAALEQLPGTSLIFVGDGPDRKDLEAAAASRGLGERVRFLGNRPHYELPGLFGAADVMVLPSASEGLANVWVEALACGTPIVITDVGGAREVLGESDAGRLVAREPGAVAAGVRNLLAAPPETETMRAVARRFSWETNSAALRDHLAGLVER